MKSRPSNRTLFPAVTSACVVLIAALYLALAPGAAAQSADFEPGALGKQRSELYLRALRSPLAELESGVNHVAVLSETCRATYGSKACGLTAKPVDSDKLEESYDYYVRRPVEAHLKLQGVKIDRRNWAGTTTPPSP
ncbi:MAG TPA: hypothetical protein VKM93_12985 [Terriglobia bacterium]|nr:hypothetical protein [Terriglobia bacterium]